MLLNYLPIASEYNVCMCVCVCVQTPQEDSDCFVSMNYKIEKTNVITKKILVRYPEDWVPAFYALNLGSVPGTTETPEHCQTWPWRPRSFERGNPGGSGPCGAYTAPHP